MEHDSTIINPWIYWFTNHTLSSFIVKVFAKFFIFFSKNIKNAISGKLLFFSNCTPVCNTCYITHFITFKKRSFRRSFGSPKRSFFKIFLDFFLCTIIITHCIPYVSLAAGIYVPAGYILITILYFTPTHCFPHISHYIRRNPRIGGGSEKALLVSWNQRKKDFFSQSQLNRRWFSWTSTVSAEPEVFTSKNQVL